MAQRYASLMTRASKSKEKFTHFICFSRCSKSACLPHEQRALSWFRWHCAQFARCCPHSRHLRGFRPLGGLHHDREWRQRGSRCSIRAAFGASPGQAGMCNFFSSPQNKSSSSDSAEFFSRFSSLSVATYPSVVLSFAWRSIF